jgi:beta-glucosidase
VDRRAQEDARRFTWADGAPATVRIAATQPIDISREATGELSLLIDYRVDRPPTEAVTLSMDQAAVPIGGVLRAAPAGQWRTLTLPLRCFVRAGLAPAKLSVPLAISTAGAMTLSVSDVRIASAMVDQNACGSP